MKTDVTPVIVGVSQFTQAKDAPSPLDPLCLMGVASDKAIKDAGEEKIRALIDTIRVVNIFSHSYEDVAQDLQEKVGTPAKNRFYSTIGGNTPQVYVNRAAQDIAAGRSKVTLIAGAEAFYSLRRSNRGEVRLDWPVFSAPRSMDGDDKSGVSANELIYDMLAPVYAYAIIENRLRYETGQSIEDHRKGMGETLSRLSQVAESNPYAWSREKLRKDDITLPSPANRMAGFPYTLRMSANLNVDQAAAVIVTSEAIAQDLKIPREKWIYPMGGATFHNVWHLSMRPELHTSPALKHAGELALQQAGLSIADMDAFDLYSCFSCAVSLARNELGVSANDPRPISLTGGLAYFGGPGNNYSLHAIASTVDYLRRNPDKKHALVTALGWLNTKWSVGVYGKEKGKTPWIDRDDTAIQGEIDRTALPEPVEKAEGRLKIESYTVVHDKKGLPHHLTVLGRLENDRRAFAFMFGSMETLEAVEKICPIGKTGRVTHDPGFGFNVFTL